MRNYLRENANSESHKASFVRYHRDYFEDEVDPAPYIEQVRKIYRDATNEEGTIDFRGQSNIEYDAKEMLKKASQLCEISCYTPAIRIYFEILRCNLSALNNSPTIYDYFLECVHEETLRDLRDLFDEEYHTLDPTSQEILMRECWEYLRSKSDEPWLSFESDIIVCLYDILIHFSKNDEEFMKLQTTIQKDHHFAEEDFYEEDRDKLLENLTIAWKGKEETLGFLDFYQEEEDEIRAALRLCDYKRAYEVCDYAIDFFCKGYPTSRNWLEWRIRIAQAERNKDLIVATAKEIYQQTRFHDEKSYALLKETIYKYEWEAFIEDLAQTIKLDQYSDKFADICIEEGWHDRLLQFLQTSGDLEKIRRFQAYLLPNYANELAQLYIDHAKGLMCIPNPQRKTYFQLRRVLQWAQKMGGTEKVKSLIEEARPQYGDKPLLLAALDRI